MGTLSSINIKFFLDLKSFSSKMSNAERKMKRFGKSMTKTGKSLTIGLTAPILAVGGYALKTAADLETMEVAFESMLGSAEKAKQLTEDLIKFTAKTPFQLDGVGKSAKQLLAFGVSQDKVLGKLKTLGDIASGANIPLSDMASIFGKIKSKNKAMTEEILQLSDRGIPIIQVLADQFGVAKSEIFNLAKQGKISFADIEIGLKSMTTTGGIFNNQMAKQSNTLAGLASTVKDNVNLAFAQLGIEISKAFNLKELVVKFIEKIQSLVTWFKGLSDETKKWIVVIGGIAAAIGPLLALAGTILPAIVAGFGLLISPIGLVVSGLVAIGVVIAKNWAPIKKVLADIANYFIDLYNESTVFRIAIEGIVLWFKNVWATASFVLRSIGDLVGFLAEKFINKFKFIGAVIKAVLTGSFTDLPGIARDAAEQSSKSFGDLFTDLKGEFGKLSSDIADNTAKAINNISGRVKIKYIAENIDTKALEKKTEEAVKSGIRKGSGGSTSRPKPQSISSGAVNETEITPIEDPLASVAESMPEHLSNINANLDAYTLRMESMQTISNSVGQGVSDAFSTMASGIVDGLGLANNGFQGFIKGLVKTITKLIAMMLASSISQSIAGATASGTATGPAALFTTPAFIATAVGGVIAAFAAIPKFEYGGIMGGNSFSGDKLFARINSGEMVLNKRQQGNLQNMLQPASQSLVIDQRGEFVLDGNTIRLVLDRVDARNNRVR